MFAQRYQDVPENYRRTYSAEIPPIVYSRQRNRPCPTVVSKRLSKCIIANRYESALETDYKESSKI
ncbi:MAG: hypothetical protein IJQ85_05065 [Selenomonadaceae bacterium]|nr:hypothetical protein [Selenomonadaceae bacterium]